MKNITSILIILIFLASLVSINVNSQNEITTYAELEQETEAIVQSDVTDPALSDVGTTPDKAGYGLKTALERIRLTFIFNRAKKAEFALRLAELKIKEARLMAANNNLDALERAKEEYMKYVNLTEKILGNLDDSEEALKIQARIEVKLDEQKEQNDELESLILFKASGLSEEQKQKLLALLEEFKSQNENFELKVMNKGNTLKTRLKAKGLSDEQIDSEIENEKNKTRNLTKEDILQRKTQHQINQAQKMYDLASRLIELVQTRTIPNETNLTEKQLKELTQRLKKINEDKKNFTVTSLTLELHTKAKAELDQAKVDLEAKQYFKAIEDARDSKKLSALTIASIHQSFNENKIEKRIEKIEEDRLKKIMSEEERFREKQLKELRERQKKLGERLKENKTDEENEISEEDQTNDESELEFKAGIGSYDTSVEAEVNDKEETFSLNTTNQDEVIAQIAQRYSLSEDQVRATIEFK